MSNLDAKILKANYIDVCAGPMSPDEMAKEVQRYMNIYSGKTIAITIDKSIYPGKPYCSIYVTRKSFLEGAHYDS